MTRVKTPANECKTQKQSLTTTHLCYQTFSSEAAICGNTCTKAKNSPQHTKHVLISSRKGARPLFFSADLRGSECGGLFMDLTCFVIINLQIVRQYTTQPQS
jgi:hypothetical protein